MNTPIRLIGLDLDGTVFDSKKRVSPRVQAAIRDAIKAGITVLPATGRQLSGVPQAFLDIEGVRYALTSNGARVSEIATGKTIYTNCFDASTGLKLARFSRGFETLTSVFMGGESFAEGDFWKYLEGLAPELAQYIRASRNQVPDLVAHIERSGLPVEKFSMVFQSEEERSRAWAAFEALGGLAITTSMPNNMEVNTAGCNKGVALLALGESMGIPREGVMAIGDSSNDLEMLEAVGFGVAMGNGTEQIKQVADHITASCDEDGVAVAIEAVLKGALPLQ